MFAHGSLGSIVVMLLGPAVAIPMAGLDSDACKSGDNEGAALLQSSGMRIGEGSIKVEQIARECEGDDLTMSCPAGTIDILDANYGRADDRSVCPHPKVENENCYALRSLSIVEAACKGLTTCTIAATNSVFGDPCHNTHKYLTVNYTCTARTARHHRRRKARHHF